MNNKSVYIECVTSVSEWTHIMADIVMANSIVKI